MDPLKPGLICGYATARASRYHGERAVDPLKPRVAGQAASQITAAYHGERAVDPLKQSSLDAANAAAQSYHGERAVDPLKLAEAQRRKPSDPYHGERAVDPLKRFDVTVTSTLLPIPRRASRGPIEAAVPVGQSSHDRCSYHGERAVDPLKLGIAKHRREAGKPHPRRASRGPIEARCSRPAIAWACIHTTASEPWTH